MFYRTHLLSSEFIGKNDFNANPPPADSFFFKAFNYNARVANATLNTKFIQGIKNGNLIPDNYGALTVLDTYYCYNGAKSFDIALKNVNPTTEAELHSLIKELGTSYTAYNKYFLDVWHIPNADSVIPNQVCIDYVKHERDTATTLHPIYTLVSMLPCYYLWYWISDQLYAYRRNNLYSYWIEGCHSANSAYVIGNFLHNWQQARKSFNEQKAMEIYTASMQYEYRNFYEACTINEAADFFCIK